MAPAAAKSENTSRRLRIVVIDDQPDTVMTMLALLRDEGYEAKGFSSGDAALKDIPRFQPDVVICDIAMPAVTGWDVGREVRKLMGEKPMLIAVSGKYTKSADRLLGEMNGYDFYLTKPTDPGALLALVASSSSRGSR